MAKTRDPETPLIKRIGLSNVIAILALIIASPSFIDYVRSAATSAEIEVFAPTDAEFRTSDLVIERTGNGTPRYHENTTSLMVDDATNSKMTYAIVPVSYINRGDAGDDLVVESERLRIEIGGSEFYYRSAFTTMIAPRLLSSWLGDTESRLSMTLSGGIHRSDEVVFVPEGAGQQWAAFAEMLNDDRNAEITITLEVATESGKVFVSAPMPSVC